MPWRGVADAYRVWISEIMLQQTTVAAVIPYYERFLTRFPTVESLAAADVQQVLALWEGLGYYSRGRNLHRAAQVIVDERGGRFPQNVDALRELPGIGRYTAGAIASFAFDARAPILEANTMRVYARLTGCEGDPRSTEGQAALWEFAEQILPRSGAGGFNQALIDLGALVCTPAAPSCEKCPLASICRAFRAGRQLEIPKPKARPAVTEVHELAVAIRQQERWLVRLRTPAERWAGLWDFPRLPFEAAPNGPQTIAARLSEAIGLKTRLLAMFPVFTHSVTRYRVRLSRAVLAYESGEPPANSEYLWAKMEELAELPMPIAARRFVDDLTRPGWDPDAALVLQAQKRRGKKKSNVQPGE